MNMKISVEIDLSEFREMWGDDTLECCIKDEIKGEVLRKVKASDEYKAMVAERLIVMMKSIDEL